MDLICPKCGEPIDNDCLHDEAQERAEAGWSNASYSDVLKDFRTKGCGEALDLSGYGDPVECKQADRDNFRTQAASALFDLMPDDPDGVAAMLEDAGL